MIIWQKNMTAVFQTITWHFSSSIVFFSNEEDTTEATGKMEVFFNFGERNSKTLRPVSVAKH